VWQSGISAKLALAGTVRVERLIGASNEGFQSVTVREQGKPRSDTPMVGIGGQVRMHRVQPRLSLCSAHSWECAEELVAAIADNDVVVAKLTAEHRGHDAQELIASCVATRIVHCLQSVDIDERQRQGLFGAARKGRSCRSRCHGAAPWISRISRISHCYNAAMKMVKIRRVGNSNMVALPKDWEDDGFSPGTYVLVERHQ